MAQYGKAMAFKEIYNMLESAGTMAKNISKQIKEPDRDYGLKT